MKEVKATELSEVLVDAIKKFKAGEVAHGKLYLTTDKRDFLYESEQELLDSIVYQCMEILRIRKLRKKGEEMGIT